MVGISRVVKPVLYPHADPALDTLGAGTPQDKLFALCLPALFLNRVQGGNGNAIPSAPPTVT